MLFYGLKGRRVIINLDTGEAFKATVLSRGLLTVRITDVDVIDQSGQTGAMLGVARIPVRRVTWLQEL